MQNKRINLISIFTCSIILISPFQSIAATIIPDNPIHFQPFNPPSDWHLILQDSFDSNNHDWPMGVEDNEWVKSQWQIIDGKYRWEATAHQDFQWYVYPDMAPISDFHLDIELQQLSGPKQSVYGIAFRISDDGFYTFGISNFGNYSLACNYRDQWRTIIDWTESGTIRPGETNKITIMTQGSHFRFAINDTSIADVDDSRLSHGKVGFWISLFNAGDEAVFAYDNFILHAPRTADDLFQEAVTLFREGDTVGAAEKYKIALILYKSKKDQYGEAKTLNNLGHIYDSLGERDTAIDYLLQALALYEEIGEADRTAYPLDGLGMVYRNLGDYEESLEYYLQALAVVQESDELEWEAEILHNIGLDYEDLSEHALAIDYLQEALTIWREVANQEEEAWALNAIGWNQSKLGDHKQAIETLGQSLEMFRKNNNQYGEAWVLANLGWVYEDLGEYSLAIDHMRQALTIRQNLNDKQLLAETLDGMGKVHESFSDYEEAIRSHQEALELWQELGNREGEAGSLIRIGWTYKDWSGYLFNRAYLQQSLDYLQEGLDIYVEVGNRAGQAEALHDIALVYEDFSEYESALDYFQQAITIWQEIGDRGEEAWALNAIGWNRSKIFDYDAAMVPMEQALQIFREIGDRYGEAWVLGNIGYITAYNVGFLKGMDYQLQALEIWQEDGDREGEGTTLSDLGNFCIVIGDYEQALEYFQQSLKIWQELAHRVNESRMINSIGIVYNRLGDNDLAMEYFQRSLEIVKKIGIPSREAVLLTNIGETYRLSEDYEQALEYLQQAKAIMEQVNNPQRYAEAVNLEDIGLVYRDMGDYEQGLPYIEEALKIMQDIRDPYGEAFVLSDLGELFSKAGTHEQALEYLNQALALWQQMGDLSGEAWTLELIGEVLESQGKAEDAMSFYLEAVEVRESMLTQVKVETFQTSLAAKGADVFQRAVRLLVELKRYDEAFNLSERGRARTFLDTMGNKRPDLGDSVDAGLLSQEEALRNELASLESGLFAERSKPQDQRSEEVVQTIEEKLTVKQQAYENLLAQIQLTNPELASLVTIPTTSVEDAQAFTDDKTTLISYYLTDSKALAFVLTQEEFHVVELPVEVTEINDAVQSFRALGLANLENPHPNSLIELYDGLIAPLKSLIHTPTVGIIPHQILHYIPFAALSDGKAYLGEQFVLFQLPSASALPFIQDKAERTLTGALILGDPKTDNPNLPSLEFAAQEAEQVADLFTTNPLLGMDASEATFRIRSGEAGVIHLAAHGGLNPAAPLFSRLWLAPGGDEDGRLNVHEIYGLNLDHAALVVLSACQTQLGEMSAGDEMISLNRSFLHGAPTVISSLWSVDDEATGTLMTRFYTYLMKGMGKAEALSLAQEDIRTDKEHPEWNHPYYWAAFVLNGDPGTTLSSERLGKASSTFLGVPVIWMVVALAVVFLFGALTIVWRVRRG